MAQQVGISGQSDACGQPGEGAAGVVRIDRRAPFGAEHQVQLNRSGWLARFDPAQLDFGGLPDGEAEPELFTAVLAECLDGEGWQDEDGVAGRGLDRPDGQLLAPAVGGGVTVAGAGKHRRVDDGEGLAEPGCAGVQVQVGPFQAAEFTVAGSGRCCEDDPGAKPG
jgi:hypothetical protein